MGGHARGPAGGRDGSGFPPAMPAGAACSELEGLKHSLCKGTWEW